MNRAIWKDKKVLVTGHTGFKGSWLSLWLSQLGAEVSGLSLEPDNEKNMFETAGIEALVDHHIGDIRDADLVQDVVNDVAPDIVMHLAAQALVRESYQDPVGTYATNVMGTLHVLEAVRKACEENLATTQAILIVTSDKCYENRNWTWGYRETDTMGGHDPYSSSKGCAELLTASYRSSYFNSKSQRPVLATARAGNVIGGGDWGRDRLVPDILRSLDDGQAVDIRNPLATRPWQHVLDPLSGYLKLTEGMLENPTDFEGGWNFGPSESNHRTVEEVITILDRLWEGGIRWTRDDAPAPKEAEMLWLDSSKARTQLGWMARLDLNAALHWTAEWYRGLGDGQDMKAFSLAQIAAFEELGKD